MTPNFVLEYFVQVHVVNQNKITIQHKVLRSKTLCCNPSLLRFTPGLRPSAKHHYVCEVINHLPRLGIPSTVKPVTYINEILPFTLID